MKRFLSLCLAAALCLALAGCASSEKQELKATLDEANGYTTVDYTMDDGTTLEQTALYDQNGIVVTALGVKGRAGYCHLWLRLENNTSSAVTLNGNSVQVNGWEMDSSLWMKVSKNSMGREYASFYPEDAGLELDSIQTITLECELMDGDYDTIDTFTATLETSAYTGELADEELPGDVLYEGDGVTLTFGGFQQERYSSYTKMQFYVENTRSNYIVLEGEEFRLAQGWELDATLYETVSAGAKRAFSVYIYPDDVYSELGYYVEYFTDSEGNSEIYDEDGAFDWTALMPFEIDLSISDRHYETLFYDTVTIEDTTVEIVDEDEAADWVDESYIDGDTDIAIAEEEPVEEDIANVMDDSETAAQEETTTVTDDTDTAATEETTDAAIAEEETVTTVTEDVRTA
ncbi:MAG: hypothetical protein LUH45_00505 [Clostridiales bacterium]|nr:hypothetical protein [Clostridiales bacterium]